MSAAIVALEIEQGAYWRQEFIYQDSEGAAIDLSGYEAQMRLRTAPAAPGAPAATLASAGAPIQPDDEPHGTITLGDAGSIVLEMEAAQTSLIPARFYVYDLELEPPDSKTVRLIKGKMNVSAEVTRA